jgi:hypothetical protein
MRSLLSVAAFVAASCSSLVESSVAFSEVQSSFVERLKIKYPEKSGKDSYYETSESAANTSRVFARPSWIETTTHGKVTSQLDHNKKLTSSSLTTMTRYQFSEMSENLELLVTDSMTIREQYRMLFLLESDVLNVARAPLFMEP